MLTSLWGHSLVTALSLSPSAEYLAEVTEPLLPFLSPASPSHVAVLLSLLGAALPSFYPLPHSCPPVIPALQTFLSSSPLLSPPDLLPQLRRRHRLEGRLRALRSESWDISQETEDELDQQREGRTSDDDWGDDADDAEVEDAGEKVQRAELRTVKAELATFPQWSWEGLTCYVLLLLTPASSHPLAPHISTLPAADALPCLLPYVVTVIRSEAMQTKPAIGADVLRGWLQAVQEESLTFGSEGKETGEAEADEAAWLLAECITTSLTQGVGLSTPTSPSLLSLFLSRFAVQPRVRLVEALIGQCPYPAVQAVLISGLKELTVDSSSPPSVDGRPPVLPGEVCRVLLGLLPALVPPSSSPLVDPLMAAMNVFRFLLLRPPPLALTAEERRQVTTRVRAVQRELMAREAEREEKVAQGSEDLSGLMLRDLLTRVLELS